MLSLILELKTNPLIAKEQIEPARQITASGLVVQHVHASSTDNSILLSCYTVGFNALSIHQLPSSPRSKFAWAAHMTDVLENRSPSCTTLCPFHRMPSFPSSHRHLASLHDRNLYPCRLLFPERIRQSEDVLCRHL